MKRQWDFALLFAAFAAITVFSNQNDWDHFYSFFEVELRSWLLDHRAPLWTYQLCAGVTRIGDPQAFGLSPLFLPVILFGSFWGAKVLVVACFAIGYFYSIRIFALLSPRSDPLVNMSLAILLWSGNYFLWHIHEGHLTVALIFFAMMPAYYLLFGFTRRLKLKESALLFAGIFAYATGGFYYSAVFVVLPLLGVFAVLLLWLRPGFDLKVVVRTLLVTGTALLCSSYKWQNVISYQKNFPRSVSSALGDSNTLWQMGQRLLLPTFNFKIMGLWEDGGDWATHEYSAFSSLPWVCLATLLFFALRKKKIDWRKAWAQPLLCCALVTLIFCLGNSFPYSPIFFINHWLLADSVRVIARFQIILLFLLSIFIARVLAQSPEATRFYLKWLRPAGAIIALLSALTFWPLLDWPAFALPPVEPAMNRVREVRKREPALISHSYMYSAVLENRIVPNCYQPLKRVVRIANEIWRSSVLPLPGPEGDYDLLAPGKQAVSLGCRRSAFVRQNNLEFAAALCPTDLCFHLNMLNIYSPANLVWNEQRQLYCVK
jgi:hypothetical protein